MFYWTYYYINTIILIYNIILILNIINNGWTSPLNIFTLSLHSIPDMQSVSWSCAPSGGQCNSSGGVQLVRWISDGGSAHWSRLLEEGTDPAGSSAPVCLSAQCSSEGRAAVSPSHTPPDNTCTCTGEYTHYIFCLILYWWCSFVQTGLLLWKYEKR